MDENRGPHLVTKPKSIVLGVTDAVSFRLLGELPLALHQSGWVVHLVSNGSDNFSSAKYRHLNVHIVAMRRTPSPYHDLLSLWHWTKLLRELKPDLVSIGTPKAAFLGMLAARIVGIPTRIYVLRGLRLETYTGLARAVLSFIERFTAWNANHILCVSHSLRDLYLRLGLGGTTPITVLGKGSSHGVDLGRFNPQNWQEWMPQQPWLAEAIDANRPIIGFVGRFCEDKGSATISLLRQHLAEAGIDHEFLVLGPVEGKLIETPRNGRVVLRPSRYLGDLDEVAPFYSIMTLLVLPTKREGFPNVILEASASSVPVIAFGATGVRDALSPGVTGLIVEPGNDEKFAIATAELLLDNDTRTRMGQNGTVWARENFDSMEVTSLQLDFYDRLYRKGAGNHVR